MLQRLSILLVIALIACGKKIPILEGIDSDKWKNDRNACLGDRKAMEPAIRHELPKLKGLSEMDIIKLFGRPDGNELYKGNQKFYRYSITPGTDCDTEDSTTVKLILRFNAMGYAQLVSIE